MASINTGRVISGGLLAGLVANVCDTTWGMTVMQADMADMARRLGMDPGAMMSMSIALPWILVDFILGLVVVWTYASMRPRFGPGPKTALLAAMVSYVSSTAVVFGFANMGMMSSGAFMRGSLTAVVTFGLAGLAGGWLYKED
jgi:hypothetical protein